MPKFYNYHEFLFLQAREHVQLSIEVFPIIEIILSILR